MEKLSLSKNPRKPDHPSSFLIKTIFIGLFLLLVAGSILTIMRARHQSMTILNAPINPNNASHACFVDFQPLRTKIFDTLTETFTYGHRLERNVYQYQDVTSSGELLLLPISSQPASLPHAGSQETHLWSKVFSPDFYYSNHYKIRSQDIPLNFFSIRNDLVQIPMSEFDRWMKIRPNIIFIGKHSHTPIHSDYQIEYRSFIFENMTIWGSVDENGTIFPQKIFQNSSENTAPQKALPRNLLQGFSL
jgi:hypothetical protein